MARPFLYHCPLTGTHVQGDVQGEPPADDESRQYEAVECAHCGRIHLVNLATLKSRSEETQ